MTLLRRPSERHRLRRLALFGNGFLRRRSSERRQSGAALFGHGSAHRWDSSRGHGRRPDPSGLVAVLRSHRAVLALLAGAVVLLAAGLVTWHVRSGPTQVSVTVHRLAAGSVSAVAGDCPYLSDCEEFDADPQALRAVTAALPGATVAASYALGIGPLRTLQYVAAATPDGVQVTVQARCDGPLTTTRSGSAAPAARAVSRPLGPRTGRGPVLVSGLRTTTVGCTVGLVAQVPRGVPVPQRALAALLADRRVDLNG